MPRRRIVHHPRALYVTVEEPTHAAFAALAKHQRTTMSEILRGFVHQYLAEHGLLVPEAPRPTQEDTSVPTPV